MTDQMQLPADVLACPEDSYAITAFIKLRRMAAYMAARYNAPVFLTGSCLRSGTPRDVDMRVVVPDSLTLQPSIDLIEADESGNKIRTLCWHGFVTDGNVS